MFPIVFERSFHMLMLKESLLRAIHDIEETFSEERAVCVPLFYFILFYSLALFSEVW